MLLYGTLHVLYIQYTSSCYWSIILRYRITLGSAEVGREKWEERTEKRFMFLSLFLSLALTRYHLERFLEYL